MQLTRDSVNNIDRDEVEDADSQEDSLEKGVSFCVTCLLCAPRPTTIPDQRFTCKIHICRAFRFAYCACMHMRKCNL